MEGRWLWAALAVVWLSSVWAPVAAVTDPNDGEHVC